MKPNDVSKAKKIIDRIDRLLRQQSKLTENIKLETFFLIGSAMKALLDAGEYHSIAKVGFFVGNEMRKRGHSLEYHSDHYFRAAYYGIRRLSKRQQKILIDAGVRFTRVRELVETPEKEKVYRAQMVKDVESGHLKWPWDGSWKIGEPKKKSRRKNADEAHEENLNIVEIDLTPPIADRAEEIIPSLANVFSRVPEAIIKQALRMAGKG